MVLHSGWEKAGIYCVSELFVKLFLSGVAKKTVFLRHFVLTWYLETSNRIGKTGQTAHISIFDSPSATKSNTGIFKVNPEKNTSQSMLCSVQRQKCKQHQKTLGTSSFSSLPSFVWI